MKVYKDLNKLPPIPNAVVTIGSFDGVHRGHQQILHQVTELAKGCQGESVVVTFHPHPRHVLSPDRDRFKLISTVEEKAQLLAGYGIDNIVVVPFDEAFYTQSPQDYIESFLMDKFNPTWIVIGYDHKFGKNRAGDITDLRRYAQQGHFHIKEIKKQMVEDIAVSSTKVRHALQEGKVQVAHQLLGHFFTLTGKVTHGQRIGHTIGFPTANIELSESYKLIPPYGVYAVFVFINKKRYKGMLYIGDRPTLADHHNKTIEVNIFDFEEDIYGEQIKVEFVAHLRDDERFENLEGLKRQLGRDKERAMEVLC